MIRFLEENGYDVSYTSGVDVSQPGYASIIEQHKVFLTAGHDEYWSGQQRANVTAARDAGVNLAFFSRKRGVLEDPVGTEHRRVQHPEPDAGDLQGDALQRSHGSGGPAHLDGYLDGSAVQPAGGRREPAELADRPVVRRQCTTTDITVPSQYSKLRFWRNTRVASLSPGQSTTLDPGADILGNEWDVDADNGFRPPGLMDMSSTTDTSAEVFTDYGGTTQTEQHRHPSPDVVPRRQRRPGVRRRDHTLVVGPGQRDGRRQRGRPGRFRHAAGHGEPPGRYGRATCHADGRAHARHGVDRHDPAHLDDHLAVRGGHLLRRCAR